MDCDSCSEKKSAAQKMKHAQRSSPSRIVPLSFSMACEACKNNLSMLLKSLELFGQIVWNPNYLYLSSSFHAFLLDLVGFHSLHPVDPRRPICLFHTVHLNQCMGFTPAQVRFGCISLNRGIAQVKCFCSDISSSSGNLPNAPMLT